MSVGSVAAYAEVNAKVRAMVSKMLTPETRTALVQAADFESVLALLKRTVYGPYLDLPRELLTPRRTAYQIRWHLAEVYEKLIRVTPQPGRELLTHLWHVYEVDNLKAALRGIEAGAPWDQIRHLLYPMAKYVTLTLDDLERVVQVEDVALAIQRIQHTPYYNTLIHALARYRAEQNLFPLEVALDMDYYRALWSTIDSLQGVDHEQALRLAGSMLDVDNLLWAIRYRVYHHLSEQEIINYTLPFGYRVQDDHIRQIAAGADVRDVVTQIYPELVPTDWRLDPSGEGLSDLESALRQHIIALCHRTFRGDPFHLGVPVAYVLLNEYEISSLTALIEAKASGIRLSGSDLPLVA